MVECDGESCGISSAEPGLLGSVNDAEIGVTAGKRIGKVSGSVG